MILSSDSDVYVFVIVSFIELKNVKVTYLRDLDLRDLVHVSHFKGKLKSRKTKWPA